MTVRKLHVLIVHNRYRSGQPSGEDRVVDQEAALLAADGHRVSRFERHSDDITSMPLLGKLVVPLRVPWNGAVRAELRALLRAQRPDIVHIHNTFPLLSPSVVAACTDTGVPAVATLHNYLQVCPSGTLYRSGQICTECPGRLPLPAIRHGCYRHSRLATVPVTLNMAANRRRWWSGMRRFFCLSESQRTTLARAGMPAELLTLKPNFAVDPGVRRAGSGKHVLYLGRIAEEKGIRLLMAAWDLIPLRGRLAAPLILAGAGPLEAEVAAWSQRRDDVVVLGIRNRAESSELLVNSAAVVMPSMWLECFGLVAVEAMAVGVPVVAAARGALADIVVDQRTGFLHQPGNPTSLATCLRRVVEDTKNNVALGNAGRRRYESNFTPELGLTNLLSGYRSAISTSGC
jgi:glycosyltransferase involved in cell wall biosynthesis